MSGGGGGGQLNGATAPAIAQDIYYIVPQKCTECVGFYDHEACAAVCPVDCCVPDPQIVESHELLLARARELHPDKTIPDDAPSRFHKEAGGAAAPAAAANGAPASAAAAKDGAAAEAAPKPAAQPAVAAPKPAPAPGGRGNQASPPLAAAAPTTIQNDEYDPVAWEVPVVCKDCNGQYMIPYRHFQAGVVFYCPQCSGSFVPTSTIVCTVRDAFEGFYALRRSEREVFERRRERELEKFEAKQAAEMDGFNARLQEIARTIKPAGKVVRKSGLASMFT
jgi:Zn finger protein HypA/HybF involved in hydrogenase expression